MMPHPLLVALPTAILLAACATTTQTVSQEEQGQLALKSRTIVGDLVQRLGGTLKADLAAHGPETAISVCKEKAPKIAGEIMEANNVQIRRVTTKNRNPKSVPDEWEAKVLADFEQRLAKGEKPDSLEYFQVVKTGERQTFRYMKGLVIQPMCLTCHGVPEGIPDGVKAKLTELYPNDQATGYNVGMLRGAVSLKKPL